LSENKTERLSAAGLHLVFGCALITWSLMT